MISSHPDASTGPSSPSSSRPRPPVEPNAEECPPSSVTDSISSEEENLLEPHSIPGTLRGAGVLALMPPNEVIEVPDVEVKDEIVEECHHTEMDSRRVWPLKGI